MAVAPQRMMAAAKLITTIPAMKGIVDKSPYAREFLHLVTKQRPEHARHHDAIELAPQLGVFLFRLVECPMDSR